MKALEALLRMFRRDDLFAGLDGHLLRVCNPFTGSDYVHLARVVRVDGCDDYKAWAGRGDVVKLSFWDEDGGQFSVHLGADKGRMFCWVTNDAPAPKRRSKARAEEATAILQSVEHLSDDDPVF